MESERVSYKVRLAQAEKLAQFIQELYPDLYRSVMFSGINPSPMDDLTNTIEYLIKKEDMKVCMGWLSYLNHYTATVMDMGRTAYHDAPTFEEALMGALVKFFALGKYHE